MNTEFWWNGDELGEVIREENVPVHFVHHKPTWVDPGPAPLTSCVMAT